MKTILSKIIFGGMCFVTVASISLAVIASQKRNYWKDKAYEYKLDAITYELKADNRQRTIDTLIHFIVNYEKQDYLKYQK